MAETARDHTRRSRGNPILASARDLLDGRLPPRYAQSWREPFYERIDGALRPGAQILDVGPGPNPTVSPEARPPQVRYVALDASPARLGKAPEGSYQETVTASVLDRIPHLESRFDLIVTCQVLEHVKPLEAALDNLHRYLKPGGLLVAQLSGRYSPMSMLNRVLPRRLATRALQRWANRSADSVFPAYYNRCSYSALDRLFATWERHEILPVYLGAGYFEFSRLLQAAYVAYEEWTYLGDRRNLAACYVCSAVR